MRLGLTMVFAALSLRVEAQDTLATVARSMYGNMAVIVQVRPNQVRLAIDDGTSNLFLSFVGTDVRRWSDSTQRLFTRRRRKADSTVWSSALHEPGMRQGTASLSIRVDSSGPIYSLFFADDSLVTIRGRVEPEDARTFARILRQASAMALGAESPATARRARRKSP
ncbi:MAG: hypothetical protein ACREOG_20785 [Gemmatimonadaceae bacterium]